MAPQVPTELCSRCLQPAPINARRCPHCGDVLKTGVRKMSLYVAALGIVGILTIVAFALWLSPPTIDPDNHPSGVEQSAPPPQPEKKPPLN